MKQVYDLVSYFDVDSSMRMWDDSAIEHQIVDKRNG